MSITTLTDTILLHNSQFSNYKLQPEHKRNTLQTLTYIQSCVNINVLRGLYVSAKKRTRLIVSSCFTKN